MSTCVICKFRNRCRVQNCLLEVPLCDNSYIYWSTTSFELAKGAVLHHQTHAHNYQAAFDSCPQLLSCPLRLKLHQTQWLLHPTHKTRYLSMQWFTWNSIPAEFRWFNPNLFEIVFGGNNTWQPENCSLIWNKYLEQQLRCPLSAEFLQSAHWQLITERAADLNPGIYVAVGILCDKIWSGRRWL
jgi:hypothetical protein